MGRGPHGKVHQGIGGTDGGEGGERHVQEALIGWCGGVIQTGQGCQRDRFGSGGAKWR